jgi:hypothetical protein
MILILRISSIVALVLACGLFVTTALDACKGESRVAEIQDISEMPGGIGEMAPAPAVVCHDVFPLVMQAEIFAASLRPRASAAALQATASAALHPSVRRQATWERLKVHATVCDADRPDRSTALISDQGSPQEEPRWVRQGFPWDSGFILEVRSGVVVFREGDQLHEVAAAHVTARPSFARDLGDGPRPVSAAIADAFRRMSSPADPNGIGLGPVTK